MIVSQFNTFVNEATRQILGGEIVNENLTPMLTPTIREAAILTDLIAVQNGLYLPPAGIDGYRQVLVNVPQLSPDLRQLSVNQNGTFTPSGFDGYSEVTVNVPNSYTQADEGKVVSNGELISQTARANPITSNGNYDTTNNNEVTVNVPNSYTQADDGKVVYNGELISQIARASQITENGTYDTTMNNSVTVNVGIFEPTLPSEYQEVEYLICNGGQWINVTSPQLKNGTMFQYKAETTNTTAQVIIGNRSNATTRWDSGFEDGAYYASNACYYIYKNVSSNLLTALLATYGTTSEGFNYGSYQYSTNYPFYGNLYTLRVHRATIINGNFDLALLLKFIPCYRKSDNVIGFYEAVNGVFYTNAGSGQFGKGGDVT